MLRPSLAAVVVALAACGEPAPALALDLVGSGTELGAALPAGFEASDVVWHRARSQYLVVGDEGRLLALSRTGALQGAWTIAGDLEGVAVADPNSSRVLLAVEAPPAIVEYDLVAGQVQRVFDLAPFVPVPRGRGLEALTFVPDAADPEGGTVLAGSTEDGRVYRFRLPLRTSATATTVTALGSFALGPSDELRGLHYDPVAGRLVALTTSPDTLTVATPTGAVLATMPLPAGLPQQPEGLALRGCELVLAIDAAPSRLLRYDGCDDLAACDTFDAPTQAVSATFGGAQVLTLDVGPAAAGFAYGVLGSRSLGSPGIAGDPGVLLPLAVDDYFLLTLTSAAPPVLSGFVGLLDAQGRGQAVVAIPPGFPPAVALVGTRLYHAAVVVDPALGRFVHASNAVPLAIAF
jgi:hypothetical protein